LSNINQAEQADRFIDTFNGTAKELFDSPKYKPDFDNIVRNWHTITDGSVLKLK
jgi:hypothetical protein